MAAKDPCGTECGAGGDGASAAENALQDEFERATDRLEKLIEELHMIGVELEGSVAGSLLDFPAMHEGREVLLCWKADEETITHWHETAAGIAGRKSVALLTE